MLNNRNLAPTRGGSKWPLRAWLNQQQNAISVSIAESVLTRIVNLAYVALCEYEGPIKADPCSTMLWLTVEKWPSLFPVRRLF